MSVISSNIGNNKLFDYGFAIVWPFGGLIKSIKDFREPIAKNLFWIFCIFYGLVHIYMPVSYTGKGGADSIRYATSFTIMHNSHFGLNEVLNRFYAEEDGSVDIYLPLVNFVVSRVTGNPHILFMVLALIYGFFYSRNIWYVIKNTSGRYNFVITVLILAFSLILPIWNINGARMWTAMQIFIYGLLPYLYHNDKKRLLWCASAFLFHFSLLSVIVLFFIFLFTPRKINWYFIIYFSTLFIHELDLEVVRERLLDLGFVSFEDRINIYTADYAYENMIEGQDNYAWHVKFFNNLAFYSYQASIFIAYFNLIFTKVQLSEELKKMFCWACFIFAFVNIVSLIPSGGRFLSLAYISCIVMYLVLYKNIFNSLFNKISMILACCILISLIFTIREGMDYFGVSLLASDFFTCWFFDDNVPLIDYVKSII